MTRSNRLLSAKQIAERTGLPLRSVYRLPLKWMRLNLRTVRVLESDLEDFLRQKREAA